MIILNAILDFILDPSNNLIISIVLGLMAFIIMALVSHWILDYLSYLYNMPLGEPLNIITH
jgi:hypothetical protein